LEGLKVYGKIILKGFFNKHNGECGLNVCGAGYGPAPIVEEYNINRDHIQDGKFDHLHNYWLLKRDNVL
jgi:hypothetical protein